MAYRVKLLDRKTGQTGSTVMALEWRDDYWWSVGNFACDCNREDVFRDACGLEREDDSHCSHDGFPDGRYKVEIETIEGKPLFSDMPPKELTANG